MVRWLPYLLSWISLLCIWNQRQHNNNSLSKLSALFEDLGWRVWNFCFSAFLIIQFHYAYERVYSHCRSNNITEFVIVFWSFKSYVGVNTQTEFETWAKAKVKLWLTHHRNETFSFLMKIEKLWDILSMKYIRVSPCLVNESFEFEQRNRQYI